MQHMSLSAVYQIDESSWFRPTRGDLEPVTCNYRLKFVAGATTKIFILAVINTVFPPIGVLYHMGQALLNCRVQDIRSQHLKCVRKEAYKVCLVVFLGYFFCVGGFIRLLSVLSWMSLAGVDQANHQEDLLEVAQKKHAGYKEMLNKLEVEQPHPVVFILEFLSHRELCCLAITSKESLLSQQANEERFRRLAKGVSARELGLSEASLLKLLRTYKDHPSCIKHLKLDGIKITKMKSLLDLCPQIEVLSANHCGICLEQVRQLVNHEFSSKIRRLEFSGNYIGNEGAAEIAKMKELTELILSNALIYFPGIRSISSMEKLTTLWLGGNCIGNQSVRLLSGMPNLEHLHLGYVDIGYDADFSKTFDKFSKEYSSGIGDFGIRCISQMPKLKTLYLWRVALSDNTSFLIYEMRQLKSLGLELFCFSPAQLMHICQMNWLEELYLAAENLDDTHAAALLANMNQLKSLNLELPGLKEGGLSLVGVEKIKSMSCKPIIKLFPWFNY